MDDTDPNSILEPLKYAEVTLKIRNFDYALSSLTSTIKDVHLDVSDLRNLKIAYSLLPDAWREGREADEGAAAEDEASEQLRCASFSS